MRGGDPCRICFHSQAPHKKNFKYDSRCPNKEFCWYCKNRCDMCMKIAGYDMTRSAIGSETLHTFCSEKCAIATGCVSVQPVIDFWDPTQNPPASFSRTCALSGEHKELVYIFAEYTSPKTGYRTFDITLCTGGGTEQFPKDKVYAVCYTRHVNQQLLFEFFLTDDLKVHKLVKLSECDGGPQDWFKDTAYSALEMIIKPVLAMKGIKDISALLKIYESKGRINVKQ